MALALLATLVILTMVGVRRSRGAYAPPTLLKQSVAQVEGGHVYVFAARVGDSAVLFDAGQDPQGRAVDALLHLLQLSRQNVHDIFLTHAHGDHIAAAPLFAQARVWAGAADIELAAGRVAPESRAGRVFSWFLPVPPVHVTQALVGQQNVSVGVNALVRAYPMPGHTAGSYAYLYDGILFVGDALLLEEGRLVPPAALFDAHPEANRAAVVQVHKWLMDVPLDRVCTAHGGCTAVGAGSRELQRIAGIMER